MQKEKGVALRCTAAAGGGIPWLTSLSRASELDEIKAVEGILNGTTNYMLSAMTNSGADYAPALRKAQELGYAEADPTADVEGLDARRKIVLSADLAFGVNIREEDIPCVGISSITAGDIAKAKDEGLTYKLIARAEKNGRAVAAFVCPTLFPSSAPGRHRRHRQPRHAVRIAFWQAELFRRGRRRLPDRLERAARLSRRRRRLPQLLC